MERRVKGGLAAGAAMLAMVALLVWVFWPSPPREPKRKGAATFAEAKKKRGKRKVRNLARPELTAEGEEFLPLEEDPRIPVVTETCKWLVTEERRNVPQWVLLDNLRDRGQLFVEDDVRCLTAAGVTPAILQFAERYPDHNKGRRGAPPGE